MSKTRFPYRFLHPLIVAVVSAGAIGSWWLEGAIAQVIFIDANITTTMPLEAIAQSRPAQNQTVANELLTLGLINNMARNAFLNHTGSDGSTMRDRVEATGYRFSSLGENIAAGQTTPAAAMQSWMNSSGHRRNILNANFTEAGFGYAIGGDGTRYWVQVFGKPMRR